MKFNKLFVSILALASFLVAGCGNNQPVTPDPGPSDPDPKPSEVTGITLDNFSLSLVPGKTALLTATVTPEDAEYDLIWSTSDENVATVSGGLVTAVGSGTADITASIKDTNFSEKCVVTVAEAFHDFVTDGSVKLGLDYTGKEFFKDGIEKVTLSQAIDGDTAHFNTKSGKTLKARFYGIDTPESTGKVQNWGYEASEFTTDKLNKAKTIVVSTPQEGYGTPNPDSTGSRYVSLIWINIEKENAAYDEVYLLNLWIVQEGLSMVRAITDIPEYEDSFRAAENQAKAYELCMWSGKKAPHYNDGDYEEVSLLDIKREVELSIADSSHKNIYDNVKVTFTGVVSSYNDNNLYIQEFYPIDDDHPNEGEWAGINIFCGMTVISEKFTTPNTYLRVYGLAKDSPNFGFQITDTQGKWKAYGTPKAEDCKVLLTAEQNTEEHSLYTKEYTVKELDTAAKSNDCSYLFCSVAVTGTITCSRAYVSESRDITLYFEECSWNVYIPFVYHGDKSSEDSSVIRWDKEEQFAGKKFQVIIGTYAWHRTTSGKVVYQIIPTNEDSFVWINE